jgi:hypothetical protein
MGMDHYCLACAFAVNPARERALRASGLTAQRRQARRGLSCQECQIVELAGESNDAMCLRKVQLVGWGRSRTNCLTRRSSYKRTQRLHGVSIEPRNVYIAGAETVQKVERNMCNAASARRCRPAGVEEHITCKGDVPEAGRSRV